MVVLGQVSAGLASRCCLKNLKGMVGPFVYYYILLFQQNQA